MAARTSSRPTPPPGWERSPCAPSRSTPPTPADLAAAIGLPEDLAATVHARVAEKLRREPVEDFRADFEDGYGNRPDAEEDGHAASAAREMAAGLAAGTLPPLHRHPHQAVHRRAERAVAAHARHLPDDAGPGDRAAGCRRTSSSPSPR